ITAVGGKVERDAARRPADRFRRYVLANHDAFVAQISGQRFRYVRLDRRQYRNDVGDCDRDAGAGKHLGKLTANVAAADDKQRFWQLVDFERRGTGQVGYARHARNWRQRWGGAGCYDDLAGIQEVSVHSYAATHESCTTLEVSDRVIARQQVDVLRLPKRRDQLVLLADQGSPTIDVTLA